jgi:hypothetical protein
LIARGRLMFLTTFSSRRMMIWDTRSIGYTPERMVRG